MVGTGIAPILIAPKNAYTKAGESRHRITMRSSMSRPSARSAFPARSTLAAYSPYVTVWPWQRMAIASARESRCASTYVIAAL